MSRIELSQGADEGAAVISEAGIVVKSPLGIKCYVHFLLS